MTSYLSCGNIMSDYIVQPNGRKSNKNMGGPAFYSLSGMKLWSDDCGLVCNAGADYVDSYGLWLDQNSIDRRFVNVMTEHTSCYQITYDIDGTSIKTQSFSVYGNQNMGYLKTNPKQIEEAVSAKTIAIYMAQGTDSIIWEKLDAIKAKHNLKIMWELERFNSNNNLLEISRVLNIVDAWSLNHSEASELFGIERTNDNLIIKHLQKLPAKMTFYRVGDRGAYIVTPNEVLYCPPVIGGQYVDQTGCGNSSTGGAMYSYFSGYSLRETLVMANVCSGLNCLQYGPIPHITKALREKAMSLKDEYMKKVTTIR